MNRRNIKELIKQGNLSQLEQVVIQGYGDRLIGESSLSPIVQEFLDRIPQLIVRKGKLFFSFLLIPFLLFLDISFDKMTPTQNR